MRRRHQNTINLWKCNDGKLYLKIWGFFFGTSHAGAENSNLQPIQKIMFNNTYNRY